MKCQPHLAGPQKGNTSHTLLLHTEGPQVKASPVLATGFNAWVCLQEPPSTNRSEPVALSSPCCQVKQNTGNTNRIITINRLLESDTGEPTPWHSHPLHGSRQDELLGGLKKVWPVGIPAQQETLWLLRTPCHPQGFLRGAVCQGREGGGSPRPSFKLWIAGKCPLHPLNLTNTACQGGNSLDLLKS